MQIEKYYHFDAEHEDSTCGPYDTYKEAFENLCEGEGLSAYIYEYVDEEVLYTP